MRNNLIILCWARYRTLQKLYYIMGSEDYTNSLFKDFWSWRLINAPEFATSCGSHEYDDRLDDMTISSYKKRVIEGQKFLSEVIKIKESLQTVKANKDVHLNLDLLEEDLKSYIKGMSFQTYLMPINDLEGPQLDYPRLLSWMKSDSIEDFGKIFSRMKFFPQQMNEIIKLLEEGIKVGITMHAVSIHSAPAVLKQLSEMIPEMTPHFKPFKSKPDCIPDNKWKDILADAVECIQTYILPSYSKLHAFLTDVYIPNTRQDIASSSLPNGKDLYKASLRFHITTDQTPEEVHNIGKAEVKRISNRMEEIKNKVGYEGTLKEFRSYLRTDKRFKFQSREEILNHYKKICGDIEKCLPNYFSKMPKSPYEIVPVPREVEAKYPSAYYLAPSADGSRPGTFYVNTYQPDKRNKYEAVALSLHEAQPGHHLQSALTMESGSLVDFRRFLEDRKYFEPPGRFGMNTAYVEGWGLYSEFLGEEMGLYVDPFDLFGRLSMEMLRACRLVVDTGMHAFGWSRQQAIEFMTEHTASDPDDIASEIDRYITWPGQACGYKIGELKINELRNLAESTLDSKFQLKEFHDLVASIGGVPLNILEKQIKTWINEMK